MDCSASFVNVFWQKAPVESDSTEENEVEVYRELFGTRFIARCEGLKMRLQANMVEEGNGERLSNVSIFSLLIPSTLKMHLVEIRRWQTDDYDL